MTTSKGHFAKRPRQTSVQAHSTFIASAARAVVEQLESRAYLSAGAPDGTFGPAHDGVALHEMLTSRKEGTGAVTLQSDGKILVSGTSYSIDRGEGRVFVSRYLASGALDPTFGAAHDGTALLDFERSNSKSEPQGLRVQTDGKIVVGLRVGRDMVLVRFNTDGTLDKTFGPARTGSVSAALSGGFTTYLTDLIIRPDGRILAGGYYNTYRAQNDLVFMQFNGDGTIDKTFGGGEGQVTYQITKYEDTVQAMTLLPNGQVLAVGSCRGDFLAIRLFADGGLDKTFGTRGVVKVDMGARDVANGVGLYRDGRFILAGESGGDFAAARFSAAGQPDTTFGVAHTGRAKFDLGSAFDVATDLAVQRDGKIVLVGQTRLASTDPDVFDTAFAAARISVDGTLDPAFGASGKKIVDFNSSGILSDSARAVAVQSDGNIVIAGNTGWPIEDVALVRLTPAGQLDGTFGPAHTGKLTTDHLGPANFSVTDTARLADGKLLVVGVSSHAALYQAAFARRFNADGTLDTTFGEKGTIFNTLHGAPSMPMLAVQADGKFILADAVQQSDLMNPKSQLVLARFNADGTPDVTYGTDGDGTIQTGFGQGGGSVETAIDSSGRLVVVAGGSVLRYTVGGARDSTFGVGGVATIPGNAVNRQLLISTLTLDASGRIVLAGTVAVRTPGDTYFTSTGVAVTRLTASGQLDTTFSPGGADGSGVLELPPPATTDDSDFAVGVKVGPGGTLYLASRRSISLPPDLSGPTPIYGQVRYEFTARRLTDAGAIDSTFGTGGSVALDFGDGLLRDIAVAADGKLLLTGSFPATGETNSNIRITRLNLNGSVDTPFGTGGTTNTDVQGQDDAASQIIMLPDGKIMIVGRSGQNLLLARYEGDAAPSSPAGISAKIANGILTITGTAGADLIRVLRQGANVTIAGVAGTFAATAFSRIAVSGLEGDDVIDMSNAAVPVTVDAGAGRDTVFGGAGDDSIIGGDGADGLFGGKGRDTLLGGEGDDYLNAGPGRDTIFGGGGKDQVLANDGEIDVIDLGVGFDGARVDAEDVLTAVESVLQ